MAIYHFSGTVISRSQGRSAMACAAYRSGELLYDERQDKTHDYTKKQDVVHTDMLLPEQAPTWMKDRETLWNAVERGEKRKDAQLAREFNFSLPKELTLEQNIALATEFVNQEFVARGMVADLAIHNDKMPNEEYQPHAHVMLTMREVTPDGFGQKVREWNAKENLLLWREAWSEAANRHLFLHGHDIKIDHRTLAAQGIDLEPQHKIGPVTAVRRSERLMDHERIAKENGEKLLADPSNDVLVGDPYQLQAIEAGAAFRAISECSPTVSLTEVRRQQIPWQREATIELATGKTAAAITRYAEHDHVHAFDTHLLAKEELVSLWNDVRINQPEHTQIMLTYTRDDVRDLNALARLKRRDVGLWIYGSS